MKNKSVFLLPLFSRRDTGAAQALTLVIVVSGALLTGLFYLQERNNQGAQVSKTTDGRDAALRANLSAIAYFQAQMKFARGASFQDLRSGVATMPALYPSPYFASSGASVSLAPTGAGRQSGSAGEWRLEAPNSVRVTLPTSGKFGIGDFANLLAGRALTASAPNTTTIKINEMIKGNPAAPDLITAYNVVATTENLAAKKTSLGGLRLISSSARLAVDTPPPPFCVIDTPPAATPDQEIEVKAQIYGLATHASFPSNAAEVAKGSPPYSGSRDLRSLANSIGPAKAMSFKLKAPSVAEPTFDGAPVNFPFQFVLTGVEPTSTYTCTGQLSVLTPKIPGDDATRVGVNFEDGGGDADFNDATFCFVGEFRVQGTQVISKKKQQVTLTPSARSDCDQNLTVTVVHPNGSLSSPVRLEGHSNQPVILYFDVGSRLEVSLVSSGAACDGKKVRSMHNSSVAIVAPNVCNTTGR